MAKHFLIWLAIWLSWVAKSPKILAFMNWFGGEDLGFGGGGGGDDPPHPPVDETLADVHMHVQGL